MSIYKKILSVSCIQNLHINKQKEKTILLSKLLSIDEKVLTCSNNIMHFFLAVYFIVKIPGILHNDIWIADSKSKQMYLKFFLEVILLGNFMLICFSSAS